MKSSGRNLNTEIRKKKIGLQEIIWNLHDKNSNMALVVGLFRVC